MRFDSEWHQFGAAGGAAGHDPSLVQAAEEVVADAQRTEWFQKMEQVLFICSSVDFRWPSETARSLDQNFDYFLQGGEEFQ